MNPVIAAVGALVGAAAGIVVGYLGFLLATFFPHMLRTALPAMTSTWFFVLWVGALMLPVMWFRTVWAGGRGLGTKVFAAAGITIVSALFAGEVAGVVHVFPWGQRFYLAPAVDRPDPPAVKR